MTAVMKSWTSCEPRCGQSSRSRTRGTSDSFQHVRLSTWNVNSLKARLPRVEEWLEYAQPDVLCLQETKLSNDTFPHLTFSALGYDVVHHAPRPWNGVAFLSPVVL